MSVSSEITRLENAKTAIKTAIKGKGVAVPDETKVDGLATLIDDIYSGAYNIVSTANSDGTQNLEITDSVGGTITKELLASLDSDFVAENIKKDVDLFGLLGTLESDGNNDTNWINSYSVFATGTFIPAEAATEWSIDTGVPFDCSGKTNYLRQSLMVWREPEETLISGLVVCAKRGYSKNMSNNSSSYYVGGALGSTVGATMARPFKADSNPLPEEGETIWTISNLNTSTNFLAGKTYRWILLGVLT